MKIKRDLKGLRFDLIDNDPDFIWKEYRKHGEYQALVWLKAYTENRAASSPRELVISMLEKINREYNIFSFNTNNYRHYIFICCTRY
jgi:hypothetical protein